mmetsp:Transcript_6955/g.7716  ORF Transcript_6955/g.7716 Transcript_6955/m.7716 type:complete len:96 (-) Transcript_6955:42-329(-)
MKMMAAAVQLLVLQLLVLLLIARMMTTSERVEKIKIAKNFSGKMVKESVGKSTKTKRFSIFAQKPAVILGSENVPIRRSNTELFEHSIRPLVNRE